jgi:hypothetical protein
MGLIKVIERLKKKVKFNNSGMTLVELIATFALISIFLVSATNIIFKTMSIYYQARGTSYGMQVSEILASKIVSMLEGAQNVSSLENTDNISDVIMTLEDGAILISSEKDEDGNSLDSVELVDATGSRVRIAAKDKSGKNYLSIHYYPVTSGQKKFESNKYYYENQLYKAVDWEFDEKTYLGYSIKSLSFEKPENFPGNVIKMKITVVSDKYGEYSTTKYIECYNFDETDYDKIHETTVITGTIDNTTENTIDNTTEDTPENSGE